ncbi:MAG: ROK family protein [Planctomycetes bacterium]|nr:ROK family protein [Planctomycetota bacterium]
MAEINNPFESNQAFKRAVNRGMVLDALRDGPASRLRLHKRTGIRLTTVGDLVEEMLAAKLLVETGSAPRGEGERGRPEQLLELNLSEPYALGVYVDKERLRTGRVNLAGKMTASREAVVENAENGTQLVAQIAREVKAVLSEGSPPLEHCLGLGLSLPGILNAENGSVLLSSAFPGLEKGPPLAQRVAQATGIARVTLGNVANSHLTAERLYGAIRGMRDAVLVILEPGQIGAAILSDGRPIRGMFESSAELGHFKIEADGPPCACGGNGCLETFIAWKYLRRQLIDKGRGDLAELGPVAFWTSEKPACAELRAEAIRRMGRAIGSLVNLTRPAAVVLSGSLAVHEKTMCEPLRAAIRRETLKPFGERLEMPAGALGLSAGIVGGASLVLQSVFTIPEVAAV